MFARGAIAPLEQSTLNGGTRLARPLYYTARAACRGLRRRVKPFCNLCDSRWADAKRIIGAGASPSANCRTAGFVVRQSSFRRRHVPSHRKKAILGTEPE